MKNAIKLFVFFCFILLLAGCSSQNLYQVRAAYQPSTEALDMPVSSVFQIGDKQVTAEHTGTAVISTGHIFRIYTDRTAAVEYHLDPNSDSFQIHALNGTVLSEYSGAAADEQALLDHVESYLHSFNSSIDLSGYEYTCSPAFGTASDGNYSLHFRTYCGDIPTANSINVQCNNSGDITDVIYFHYDSDWSSVSIDEDKVTRSVSAFLEEGNVSIYPVTAFEITEQKLISTDGKIALMLSVKVTVDGSGNEYPVLVNVLVNLG